MRRLCALWALFISTGIVAGDIRYVDADTPNLGDGRSWDTAYRHLQDALHEALQDPTITELRLAAGTYRPDQNCTSEIEPGDRDAVFEVRTDLAIVGGYRGGSHDPDARDPNAFVTVLSGAIHPDPARHSVRILDVRDAVFRLSGCNVEDATPGALALDPKGGGVFVHNSVAEFDACRFRRFSDRTSAPYLQGGAIWASDSELTVRNCHFEAAHALAGSMLFSTGEGTTVLSDTTFGPADVSSTHVEVDQPLRVTNCRFVDLETGLAVQARGPSELINCSFERVVTAVGAEHVDVQLDRCHFDELAGPFFSSVDVQGATLSIRNTEFRQLPDFAGLRYRHDVELIACRLLGEGADTMVMRGNLRMLDSEVHWPGLELFVARRLDADRSSFRGVLQVRSDRMRLDSCLVADCGRANGGSIFYTFYLYEAFNTVFVDNRSDLFAAGPVINQHCTFVNNPGIVGLAFNSIGVSTVLLGQNNLLDRAPPWGMPDGAVIADPRLAAPADGDFRLLPGSPAIDAARDVDVDRPATDALGQPRVYGRYADLGAYEAVFPDCDQDGTDDQAPGIWFTGAHDAGTGEPISWVLTDMPPAQGDAVLTVFVTGNGAISVGLAGQTLATLNAGPACRVEPFTIAIPAARVNEVLDAGELQVSFWSHLAATEDCWPYVAAQLEYQSMLDDDDNQVLDTCQTRGDADGDGVVTLSDLAIVLATFGVGGDGDVDLDGGVDVDDLMIVLAAFGS